MKHLGNGLGYSFIGEVLPLFLIIITCARASARYWNINLIT